MLEAKTKSNPKTKIQTSTQRPQRKNRGAEKARRIRRSSLLSNDPTTRFSIPPICAYPAKICGRFPVFGLARSKQRGASSSLRLGHIFCGLQGQLAEPSACGH
jgi:hypothetical protein